MKVGHADAASAQGFSTKSMLRGLFQPPGLFYILVTLAMALQMVSFYILIGMQRSPWWDLYFGITDSALFLLPFLLLPRRWRWVLFIPLTLSALLTEANVIYFRNFHEAIPLINYFQSASYNSFVADAALSSLAPKDISIWLPAAIPAAWYVMRGREIENLSFPASSRLFAAGMAVLMFLLLQFNFLRIAEKRIPTPSRLADYIVNPKWYDNLIFLRSRGAFYYTVAQIPINLGSGKELSPDEKMLIKTRTELSVSHLQQLSDIAVTDGTPFRRLILIIVESLDASALRPLDGQRAAMPWLASLSEARDALLLDDVADMTGIGRSSDGQLIINTGLLPLESEPYVFRYVSRPFPSLPHALQFRSEEIIGEAAPVWNHGQSSKAFGYDSVSDWICRDAASSWEYDRLILNAAEKRLKTLPDHALAQITTLTMHSPYEDSPARKSWISSVDTLTVRDRIFYERCMATDLQLRQFVERILNSPDRDSTLIVITSDHAPGTWDVDKAFTGNLVFALIGKGMTAEKLAPAIRNGSRPVTQADIFPTLLHAMGRTDYVWGGFGRSIFDPSLTAADTVTAADRDISRLMITSGQLPVR